MQTMYTILKFLQFVAYMDELGRAIAESDHSVPDAWFPALLARAARGPASPPAAIEADAAEATALSAAAAPAPEVIEIDDDSPAAAAATPPPTPPAIADDDGASSEAMAIELIAFLFVHMQRHTCIDAGTHAKQTDRQTDTCTCTCT